MPPGPQEGHEDTRLGEASVASSSNAEPFESAGAPQPLSTRRCAVHPRFGCLSGGCTHRDLAKPRRPGLGDKAAEARDRLSESLFAFRDHLESWPNRPRFSAGPSGCCRASDTDHRRTGREDAVVALRSDADGAHIGQSRCATASIVPQPDPRRRRSAGCRNYPSRLCFSLLGRVRH